MANFITIDINSILNKNTTIDDNQTAPKNNTKKQSDINERPIQKKPANRIDWSKELKKRLNDNRALDQEARVSDFEIETQFWSDFFNANWPEDVAEILDKVIGEQLKKDIKILGFKKQTNPILAFLKLSYVQKELIKTKLLNDNTYKAVHNAVAKHYIADSELFKVSDYNIIYCKDLYTKRITDIEVYLKIQKEILPTNVSEYTVDRQNRNKSIFLEAGKKSVKQKGAKLKSLKEIQKLTGVTIENTSSKTKAAPQKEKDENAVQLDTQELVAFIGNSTAKAAATLQFIGMSSGHPKAFNELKKFGNIPMDILADAANAIAKKFNNAKIDTKTAEAYINSIVNRVIPYLKLK